MKYTPFISLIALTSICFGYLEADFDRSGVVDSADFARFANEWLQSGGPEPYGFAVTVAASDSSTEAKQTADYVCDGNHDNVEIQAAIDALPNWGGKVVLSGGHFSISSAISLYRPNCPVWFNVWLCGQGASATRITVANGADCNGIENVATGTSSGWIKLSDMTIDGNRDNNTRGSGYYSRNAGGTTYDVIIWNVFFTYWSGPCIDIWNGWHVHIHDIWTEMSDSRGIRLQGSECKISDSQISTLGGTGLELLGAKHVVTNCVIRDTGCYGVSLNIADHLTLSNLTIQNWGQTTSNFYSGIDISNSSAYNCISNVTMDGDDTNKSCYGTTINGNHNLVSNVSVQDTYNKPLRIGVDGNDNIVSACYFEPGVSGSATASDSGSRNRIVNCSGAGQEETVTALSPTLSHWGITKLDSSSNAINATLPDGQYLGETKIIVMTNASNPCTVSAIHHETSDPEVATFDAVDEVWCLIWTGNEWATTKASCTF